MIRQARTYLAGAVSGTALIAVAIVGFVLLVSLQAFERWPLAGPAGGRETGRGGSPSTVSSRAGARTGSTIATRTGSSPKPASAAPTGGGGGTGLQADTVPAPTTPSTRNPTTAPAASGGPAPSGGPTASGSGGGEPGGSGGGGGSSLPGTVAGTVNDAVAGVDNVLGESGITGVAVGTTDGAAPPSSPAGGTVDRTAEAVGGLLDDGS